MTLNFTYIGTCNHVEIHLTPGKYLFEAWGAAGGTNDENFVGKGGYTSGLIQLAKQTRFYAIIGSRGQPPVYEMKKPLGGCGGGGKGGLPSMATHFSGAGGGGATIIYYDTKDLASRIMVSGGGGGNVHGGCTLPPGYGGGVIAGSSGSGNKNLVSTGASQTFGRDSLGGLWGDEGNSGCGGGYRGGTTTTETGHNSDVSGSGGSSYISGHPQCSLNALASFFDTKIYAGNQNFYLPNGVNSLGNPSDGYLRITTIPSKISCQNIYYSTKYFIFFICIFIIES